MTTEIFVTEEIVELVAEMLAKRWNKCQIKKTLYHLADRHLAPGTCEKVLSSARELIRKRSLEPKTSHIAKSVAFYESVIADDGINTRDRLLAQEALNKMLGVGYQYSKDSVTDPDEEAKELRAAMQLMDQRTGVTLN